MLMLGKELLSGLWVRPECRSFAVIFTLDHVSPSCFTVLSLLTTLVATRCCRCLLRSASVNVMPERLLFVISGILSGGIPGFALATCCDSVLVGTSYYLSSVARSLYTGLMFSSTDGKVHRFLVHRLLCACCLCSLFSYMVTRKLWQNSNNLETDVIYLKWEFWFYQNLESF